MIPGAMINDHGSIREWTTTTGLETLDGTAPDAGMVSPHRDTLNLATTYLGVKKSRSLYWRMK